VRSLSFKRSRNSVIITSGHSPEEIYTMKMTALILAGALAFGGAAAIAQTSDSSAAKSDMKGAGTDTKDAGKDVGHGVANGTKATGHGIKKGAKATGHGVETGTKDTGKGMEKAGHKIAHPHEPASTPAQ
jgi:hypothetical protein